jgi:hypothetical protein
VIGENNYGVYVRKTTQGRFSGVQEIIWRILLKLASCIKIAGYVINSARLEQGPIAEGFKHLEDFEVSRRGGNRLVN